MERVATHPLDLPLLKASPSAEVLLQALEGLELPPPSWDGPAQRDVCSHQEQLINSSSAATLSNWLTRLVGCDLWWIDDDDLKERIWSQASTRMAERCGRTAAPAMTRTFCVPTSPERAVSITLHEPPLTSDSMGLKTWASSYLLAKRLHLLVPSTLTHSLTTNASLTSPSSSSLLCTLELGSGTGLVGLAAAAFCHERQLALDLHLTDLPEVVPNLARNIDANGHLFVDPSSAVASSVLARVLDWTTPLADEYWQQRVGSFDLILASDPLYSPQHPALLVSCVSLFLRKPQRATEEGQGREGGTFIIEHPLRPSYMGEVADCEARLCAAGLVRVAMGEEVGWDDWGTTRRPPDDSYDDEQHPTDRSGVKCRWGAWQWTDQHASGLA